MTTTRTLKTPKLPPHAKTELVVSAAEHDGQQRVLVHVRQFDRFDIGYVTAVHSMSREEARDYAQRLLRAAEQS